MSDPIRPTVESTLRYEDLVCRDPDEPSEADASRMQTTPRVAACLAEIDEEPHPAGVADLVRKNASPPLKQPVGNNNAERASQVELEPLHVAYGQTENGSYYVNVALLYGKDPHTGVVLEVGSLSAQIGRQTEIQGAVLRKTTAHADGSSVTLEYGTGQVSAGTHNRDGSRGLNVSGGFAESGVEITRNFRGSSATVSAANGKAFELSIGVRDSD